MYLTFIYYINKQSIRADRPLDNFAIFWPISGQILLVKNTIVFNLILWLITIGMVEMSFLLFACAYIINILYLPPFFGGDLTFRYPLRVSLVKLLNWKHM